MTLRLTRDFSRRLHARRLRLGPSIVETRFEGCQMLVRPREDVGRNMALGEFETDDLRHFMSATRPGDLVFDIGANVGACCVPIAKANPDAKIYAFEPIPLNAALIDASLQLNGLQNVKVVRSCVGDRTGVVEFSLAEDSAYSSMLDTHRKAEVRKFECPTITLDDFRAGEHCGVPGVVKVDVEGAELKVLQGGASIFGDPSGRPRLVLVELYDQNLVVFGTSISEVTALMLGWQYRPYVLIDGQKVAFTERHHNLHYNVFFEA